MTLIYEFVSLNGKNPITDPMFGGSFQISYTKKFVVYQICSTFQWDHYKLTCFNSRSLMKNNLLFFRQVQIKISLFIISLLVEIVIVVR